MNEKFFDANILEKKEKKDKFSIKEINNLQFHFKKSQFGFQFFIQLKEQRLNASEIKEILQIDEKLNLLSQGEKTLFNYLAHKLFGTITIYKILNDFDFFISCFRESKKEIFLNSEKIKIKKEKFKLDLEFKFDENNNIVLNIKQKENGIFIFGINSFFLILENSIYSFIENDLFNFFKQILSGNNLFSIESFISLNKKFIPNLKKIYSIKFDEKLTNIDKKEIKTKIAPIILEISKTLHFIICEFKYKIDNEFFKLQDFKYLETESWFDKKEEIKVILEKNELISYNSNLSFSEINLRTLFEDIRISYTNSVKFPFLAMIPISNLEIFISKVLPKAEKLYKIIYKDGIKLRVENSDVEFEINTNLKQNLNLFEFNVKFKIGDEYFDVEFLKELLTKSKKLVQLKNGLTINIENIREINKWIEFLNKYEFNKSKNGFKAKSSAALELDEFLKSFPKRKVVSNEEFKIIISELNEKKPISKVDIPKEVSKILRDYQKEGIYWLYFLKKYNFNGILADEMGLGKTIQALTILKMTLNEGNHLIVCPKSLIYNWKIEAKKYFPNLKILIIDGDITKRNLLIKKIRDYDLVITSYSMLQKDYSNYLENEIEFNYLVLDEAHYVKNMRTLTSKAVRFVKSKRMILLSGTPIENNLDELYGTFELIMPGFLGSKLEFTREFASKIERNNRIALEILQAKIRPFILRRTKTQVLKELPDKQEQIIFSEMTNKQVALYNEILQRVKGNVFNLVNRKGFDRSRIEVLSALLKLRQICNHPGLLEKEFKNEKDISGKFELFLELLNEVIDSGEKVLIFSQFTSMLDIFSDKLKELNIEFLRLDGSTKNRQDVVDEFNNNKKIKIFLISLKAGGVGLNLTSASVVFLYDPWWNPMVERQAMDRVHRIGQTKKVNIYKFITRNSIEEKILKLQERKGNLFENIISDRKGFLKKLEWEDLMELFD